MTAEVDGLIERVRKRASSRRHLALCKQADELDETADALSRLQRELQEAKRLIADYEEVIEDKRRICREIDVAMFGKDAAKQPSLCDIQASVVTMARELQEQQRVVGGLRKDAEFVCGCEWNDARELEAACLEHWRYFWKLHGPHCQTPTPKNFTAGTDPAKWNISGMSAIDAARSEGEKP